MFDLIPFDEFLIIVLKQSVYSLIGELEEVMCNIVLTFVNFHIHENCYVVNLYAYGPKLKVEKESNLKFHFF